MYQTISSSTQPVPKVMLHARAFAKTASLLIIGLGCLVLIGWILHIEALKRIIPGLAAMNAITALLFVLCGLSLYLQVRHQNPGMAQLLATAIILISLLILMEYIFRLNFGIDQFIVKDANPGGVYSDRPASGTALGFCLAGVALLHLHKGSRYWFQEISPVLIFVMALMALTGYLYDVSALYRNSFYASMTLPTSLGLTLISLGILFAHPENGLSSFVLAETAGGKVLRRMLPASVLLPIFLGLIGLMGEHAGMYAPGITLAFVVNMLVFVQSMFIWSNALQLNRVDRENKQIFNTMQASEQRFHTIIESMAEGFQLVGADWRHIYVNDAAVKNTRLSQEQLVGHTLMECFPGIENLAIFESLRSTMQDRIPRRITTKYTFPDGTSGWFDVRVERVEEGVFILSTDITRQHQAEQALLESEMKLATILNILPVGVVILNTEREVIFTNPAVNKNLHMSEEEMRTGAYNEYTYLRTDGTLMSPEEIPSMRAVAEGREIMDVEIGMVKKDENTIWMNVSAVPANISDWRVLVVASDITARKQAEAAVQESERRMRALINAIPDLIFRLNRKGVFLSYKAEKEDLYTRSTEIVGKTYRELMPSGFSDLIDKQIETTFETGETQIFEYYLPIPERGQRDYEARMYPSDSHEVTAIVRDITEIKQAELAIREAYERQQRIVDTMFAFVGLLSLDGLLLEANRAPFAMSGLTPQDVFGKPFAALPSFAFSADNPARIQGFIERAASGEMVREDLLMTLEDGRQLTIDTVFAPLRDSNDDIVQVVISGVDITDRKQMEVKLQELNAELEERVAERTAELTEANEKLHQIAIVDELTGLHNRRGFLFLAEQQFRLARRSQRNILIFYADLDELKRINDLLGHGAGDQALMQVAEAMSETFRVSDIKARLGGDEFIVLAMEAHQNDSQTLLARLQRRLAANNLSVSVGVISFDPQEEMPIEKMLTLADQAMYADKHKKNKGR